MAKDTYYFQHDYEPTSDPKIQALLKQYDWTGYGLFWRIIEMLHSDPLHKLPKKNFIFISLSSGSTTVEQVLNFVESCISDFELFVSDGNYFWSDRVFSNIDKRDEISKKASKGGKASAEKRKKATAVERPLNVGSTTLEPNSTKKRKEKEIINNTNPAELVFSINQILKEGDWRAQIWGQSVTDFENMLTIQCKDVYEAFAKDYEDVFPELLKSFKKTSFGETYDNIDKFQRHFKSYCLKMHPIEVSKKRKAEEKAKLDKPNTGHKHYISN